MTEPDVAELQVEVDERDAMPSSASATARHVAVSVLPVPPFGPSTQISGARVKRRGLGAAGLARDRLLQREQDVVRRLGQHDHVVGAGREHAAA